VWLDGQGRPSDPLEQLKDFGVDAVRLRVMVDPDLASGVGFTDPDHVAALARRCLDSGISRLMVDFHLSDSWADPAKQTIPARWRGASLDRLASLVADHVTAVLQTLGALGVVPEWVQVGNEIPHGLLWAPQPGAAGGRVEGDSGWDSLAALVNAGYGAVKAACPRALTLVHLDRGYDQDLYRAWFDRFAAAGGRWDVTGLSFYPHWQPQGTVDQLAANLRDLASRYDRPVMVCEVGGRADDPAGTHDLLVGVQRAVASVPGGRGLGTFYWEPAASPEAVGGYLLGASESVGPRELRFTRALEAFDRKNFKEFGIPSGFPERKPGLK
jgi:arabinogalactan endo-1,4-beta-galactosidase